MGEEKIVHRIVEGSVALMLVFLLLNTLILPFFADAYAFGLGGATTVYQGVLFLVFVIVLIMFGVLFVPNARD